MQLAKQTISVVLALASWGAVPPNARAGEEAGPRPKPGTKTEVRGELHGASGAALVIGEHRFASDARWALPWSLSLGAMVERGPWFKATIGGAFEHRVFFLPDATVHSLHGLIETRVGAGRRRAWAYGLVGLGAAGTRVDWESNSEDDAGIVVQLGAGVRAQIGRRAFIGGELDFDLGHYFAVPAKLRSLTDYSYQTVSFELLLGLHFGGRRR